MDVWYLLALCPYFVYGFLNSGILIYHHQFGLHYTAGSIFRVFKEPLNICRLLPVYTSRSTSDATSEGSSPKINMPPSSSRPVRSLAISDGWRGEIMPTMAFSSLFCMRFFNASILLILTSSAILMSLFGHEGTKVFFAS